MEDNPCHFLLKDALQQGKVDGETFQAAIALCSDTEFGEAASQALADLAQQHKWEELKALVQRVTTRRHNIDAMRKTLEGDSLEGYDVIIISSSTAEEAEAQQKALENAFMNVRTSNVHLNNQVLILSVMDHSEGGQILGQAVTWHRAATAYASLAKQRQLPCSDLTTLVRTGAAKVAIYHNGGKGERASPATQSLGNSRAAQKLVGSVRTKDGTSIELNLLLAVVLQTSAIARSNDGTMLDTFWTNQLSFGTHDFANLHRPPAALAKFTIGIDQQAPNLKDLYDYGTARLDQHGHIQAFLANKKLTKRDPSGRYVRNEAYQQHYHELMQAQGAAFDFGSFSMSYELHFALIEYWEIHKGVLPELYQGQRSTVVRDIDPAFIQIMVPFINGLQETSLPADLPVPRELRTLPIQQRNQELQQAVSRLKRAFPASTLATMTASAGDRTDYIDEAFEFYLLFRDKQRVFGRSTGKIASIDLGKNSYWFAYKRLLDIGNEKFMMLADLAGKSFEIDADGKLDLHEATLDECIKAEDARRLRSIPHTAVAQFELLGKRYKLSLEQVRTGVSLIDGEISLGESHEPRAVYIRGSVIQGDSILLPGSRIIHCVINNSAGLIIADHAYIESTTAPKLRACNSVIHKVIHHSDEELTATSELISDVFREDLNTGLFPAGQTRMQVPINYDPKQDHLTTDVSGLYSFQQIRDMPCVRSKNEAIETHLRSSVVAMLKQHADACKQ